MNRLEAFIQANREIDIPDSVIVDTMRKAEFIMPLPEASVELDPGIERAVIDWVKRELCVAEKRWRERPDEARAILEETIEQRKAELNEPDCGVQHVRAGQR